MSIIDLSRIETTPGTVGEVFAPPADFAGDADAYAKWAMSQYDRDLGFRQYMCVLAKAVCGRTLMPRPTIAGPYADRLQQACRNLDAYLHRNQDP